MRNIFKRIKNLYITAFVTPRQPLHIEFVLSDYCNLNCKGCTHYSPLAPATFQPLEQLERDASHLGKTVGNDIESAYLIGGETLLYPELTKAMSILRRHFKGIPVKIFTNGLLLPRMDDSFWKAVKDNDITLSITRYPIKFDYDAVEALCNEKGIKYEVFADRGDEAVFFRYPLDTQKKQNPWIAHFRCYNRGCISIVDSKIYPCSISACISHVNNRFGTDFRHCKGDYIEVSDVTSIKQLKKLRNRPVPFCGYCKKNTVTKYGPSKRAREEWVD